MRHRPRTAPPASSLLSASEEACQPATESALREAEEARKLARQSEALYRLLFDATPMPVWVFDRETLRFLAVNESALKQYSYSREEFLSMTLADIRPAEDVVGLRQAIADAPQQLHRLSGWRHRRKDGSLMDVEIIGHLIEFDGRPAELILVNDVTQRRRAETELRESTDVLRAVVNDSPLAIIVLDLDLAVTRWNPAAERLLGWSAEEMLGKSYSVVIPKEKLGEHHELREDAVSGRVTMDVQTRRLRKDGSLIDVSLSVTVLRDAVGAVRGFAVVLADVTERRRLEAQFRQAQKMEAVGQLAGGIAHDFNNLLTVITSYSGLLLADLPADSAMRADVQQISGAANRAATLTRQLLAFSRQQILRPQVLALNSVVAGLEPMLRRLVREDIEIATSLDASLGAVEADPGQVEQVMVNLVVNARDAMPDGGTLTIQTANAVFDAESMLRHSDTAIAPGQYVMLAVSDTGTGMTPDIQARVFEPFYTTKEPGLGTGLGLSTVYGIVKQSDGYIWVYSEPGRGTTFRIYLPRVDTEPEHGTRDGSHGAHLAGHETVLVVEDDAALRAVACRAIRSHGYEVLEAQNGREALEICDRHEKQIHLVVSDVVMPEMGGGDLAHRIAASHPDIKILLMSGYTRDVVARESIIRDGSAFIEKPFTLDKLAEKMREVLDGRAPGDGR